MRSGASPSPSSAVERRSKTTTCCIKAGLKRGAWTPEEDKMLSEYIKKEGDGRWGTLPKRAGLRRCGKSCRRRWMNYLRPDVKRGHIAADEEDLILRLHSLLGNRWSLIAGRIPGRTDNEIKNYWYTHLSKKLSNQGIDPKTHKPLHLNSPSNDKPSTSKSDPSTNPNPKFVVSYKPIGPGNHGTYYKEKYANDGQYQGFDVHNSEGIWNEGNIEDDDVNYCTDDVFSAFLNSLINEDIFDNNENQMQEQQQLSDGMHNVVPHEVRNSDALISSPQRRFSFAAAWNSPKISTFNQNEESKRSMND